MGFSSEAAVLLAELCRSAMREPPGLDAEALEDSNERSTC